MSGSRCRRKEGTSPIMFILVVVICIVLVLELTVPRIIASQLEDAIESSVDKIESVRVRLRAFPAINLLSSGAVNSISIDCRGLFIEGLRIESLMIDASDILIQREALAEKSSLVLSHIGQGQAEVVLTEDDLTSYVRGLDGVPDSVLVELNPGQVTVRGHVNVAGMDIPVELEGEFVAEQGGACLSYAISHIRIGNAMLPSIITDGFLSGLSFSLDMSSLPIPVVISDVIMEDKIVSILGRTLSDNRESM